MLDLKLGGRYKMGKKLGSGAFGEAYLGKWHQTNFFLARNNVIGPIFLTAFV